MAINPVWQDVRVADTPIQMPNMQSLAIDVSRRMNRRPVVAKREQPVAVINPVATVTSRPSYNVTTGLANPVISQPENISRVAAMSNQSLSDGLSRAWDLAQKWEGGYSNDPDDRGGETNFGIAANFNPGVDVKKLTKQDAMNIYNKNYYQKSGADRMAPGVGLYLADAAFNQGLGGMASIMENAIGTRDIDAMNAMNQREVLEKLHEARMARYRSHPKWDKYGKGWTNRANDGLARALALIGG